MFATGLLVAFIAYAALPTGSAAIVAPIGFAVLGSVLLVFAKRVGADRAFGPANGITCLRLGLAALLIGAIASAPVAVGSWWVAGFACTALILDGVDGLVARARNIESPFGALFDQETDAALILVLTLILSVSEKTGYWIVVAGLMRYVLLGAGLIWPVLTTPLPKSRIRSVVCGGLVAALVVCLLPVVDPRHAGVIGAIALFALTLSFSKDLIWLLNTNAR